MHVSTDPFLAIIVGIVALLAVAFMVSLDAGKRRKQMVDTAIRAASKRLVGRAAPTIDAHVEQVFSYGAVDISAEHCVVWIMLEGLESQRIPEWLTLAPDGSLPEGKLLAAELAEWMCEIHGIVLAAFSETGWGDRPPPTIGFESSERVAAGGGWHYFK